MRSFAVNINPTHPWQETGKARLASPEACREYTSSHLLPRPAAIFVSRLQGATILGEILLSLRSVVTGREIKRPGAPTRTPVRHLGAGVLVAGAAGVRLVAAGRLVRTAVTRFDTALVTALGVGVTTGALEAARKGLMASKRR